MNTLRMLARFSTQYVKAVVQNAFHLTRENVEIVRFGGVAFTRLKNALIVEKEMSRQSRFRSLRETYS